MSRTLLAEGLRLNAGHLSAELRGFGRLVEELRRGQTSFRLTEQPQFEHNGIMVDASRNSVPTVDTIRRLLRLMAVMGLDWLMMYTEDTFTVPEYPYFGYMRGRYTHDELKACDDEALALGIEMIPCIQTLPHMTEALKWNYAAEFRDTEDILLVGRERTYEYVEGSFAPPPPRSAAGAFISGWTRRTDSASADTSSKTATAAASTS